MSSNEYNTPDFVLAGYRYANGICAVIASTDLRGGVLKPIPRQWHENFMNVERLMDLTGTYGFSLTMEFDMFTLAIGRDYAEAMKRLLATWTPPQAKELI